MRIIVSHELCEGHARCWSVAPEVFELDDSGYIKPGNLDVPEGLEKQATRGVKSCPERALAIEGDTGRWGTTAGEN